MVLAFLTGGMPGIGEIGIILLVLIFLFGAKKLPQLARSLGSSLTESKRGRSEDTATRAIPVVMLTSVNAQTDLAFDAGLLKQYLGTAPSLFLEKPVTQKHLLAEIAQVLAE